jgi:arginine decarboxylase
MLTVIPNLMFFTRGVGKHRHKLQSFEVALRDAGIAPLNLVKVSSILPPGCKIISRGMGLRRLEPGQITHCVLADAATNEPNRLVAAGIGLAMLASTLGLEFDADADYDERREIYRMSGQIVTSRACVQTAEGDKNGLWTTVVAAAVFVPD